jgi:hypothetical protein
MHVRAHSPNPRFGIEQEYTLLNALTKWPLGWPDNGYPAPQGPYYCSAGAGCAIGRDIADVHYKVCLGRAPGEGGARAIPQPGQRQRGGLPPYSRGPVPWRRQGRQGGRGSWAICSTPKPCRAVGGWRIVSGQAGAHVAPLALPPLSALPFPGRAPRAPCGSPCPPDVPVCRREHQRCQRRGHARPVGVPGGGWGR